MLDRHRRAGERRRSDAGRRSRSEWSRNRRSAMASTSNSSLPSARALIGASNSSRCRRVRRSWRVADREAGVAAARSTRSDSVGLVGAPVAVAHDIADGAQHLDAVVADRAQIAVDEIGASVRRQRAGPVRASHRVVPVELERDRQSFRAGSELDGLAAGGALIGRLDQRERLQIVGAGRRRLAACRSGSPPSAAGWRRRFPGCCARVATPRAAAAARRR